MTTTGCVGRFGFVSIAAAAAIGCQLDPGNFEAFQFKETNARVAHIHVSETPDKVTTEHWVFNGAAYDSVLGVDTVPSRDPSSFSDFKTAMCGSPIRKYLMVATTEFPLSCPNPTQPTVPTPPDAILGDGSYRVFQSGVEVGSVFVQNKVEHWGVITGTFVRSAGFSVRPSTPGTYADWAAWVCTRYSPRTYWVVTASIGSLCT